MDHHRATNILRWTHGAFSGVGSWLVAEFGKAPLALALSILSICAAGYQYWQGQRQARINAAVELSRTYLVDPEIPSRYAMFVDGTAGVRPGESERFLRARSYLDFLDYIAGLANKELINNDYVISRIKCDIHWVRDDLRLPADYRLGEELKKYVAKRRTAGCEDRPPPNPGRN